MIYELPDRQNSRRFGLGAIVEKIFPIIFVILFTALPSVLFGECESKKASIPKKSASKEITIDMAKIYIESERCPITRYTIDIDKNQPDIWVITCTCKDSFSQTDLIKQYCITTPTMMNGDVFCGKLEDGTVEGRLQCPLRPGNNEEWANEDVQSYCEKALNKPRASAKQQVQGIATPAPAEAKPAAAQPAVSQAEIKEQNAQKICTLSGAKNGKYENGVCVCPDKYKIFAAPNGDKFCNADPLANMCEKDKTGIWKDGKCTCDEKSIPMPDGSCNPKPARFCEKDNIGTWKNGKCVCPDGFDLKKLDGRDDHYFCARQQAAPVSREQNDCEKGGSRNGVWTGGKCTCPAAGTELWTHDARIYCLDTKTADTHRKEQVLTGSSPAYVKNEASSEPKQPASEPAEPAKTKDAANIVQAAQPSAELPPAPAVTEVPPAPAEDKPDVAADKTQDAVDQTPAEKTPVENAEPDVAPDAAPAAGAPADNEKEFVRRFNELTERFHAKIRELNGEK